MKQPKPLMPVVQSFLRSALVACLLLVVSACGGAEAIPVATAIPLPSPTEAPAAAAPVDTEVPVQEPAAGTSPISTPDPLRVPAYGYTIINTYPHDPGAYTQGLQYVEGEFYEGTGRHGESSLRRVAIETGEVLQQLDLDAAYFGEGIVVIEDQIWQLTWQEQTAFLYDRTTFAEKERFTYETEGWGLTFDGEHLIMSDGTPNLYFRDPATFAEVGRVEVTYLGEPLDRLNELEYINGEVWANIYQSNFIVRINPESGVVQGVLDLSGILDGVAVTGPVDVLNGIAWDEANERLFVTGKWWPALFEITIQQVGWAE